MKAVTHDGPFHADDVFADAVLRAALDNVRLARTRDPAMIADADLVFDVGGVYDPAARRYDHHMRERPLRPDGTPYSSVGLIWRDFGRAALPALLGAALDPEAAEAIWRDIDAGIIFSIDQADNGVAPAGPGHLSAIIEAFNPVWDGAEDPDAAFGQASRLAQGILARAAAQAHAGVRAAGLVRDAARASEDPRILTLDRKLPWERMVYDERLQALLFVIYPGEDRTRWYCRCVPPEPGSFDQRLPLPAAWAGLRDAEFSAAAGIADGVFCHPSRFICAARDRASAVELARRAIALGDSA
jgi:uncharacterized UPF0160 family protein